MLMPLVRLFVDIRSVFNRIRSNAHPPRTMPPDLVDRYTMGAEIPLLRYYIHEGDPKPLRWTTRSFGWFPQRVAKRKRLYYGDTDLYLYQALDACNPRGLDLVILGSETPWYECICVHYGAKVTTIEYRDVDCQIPGLRVVKPDVFENAPAQFDLALSISSVEHAGLGRYGDPLDPDADLKAMADMARLLKPGGKLVLAVPMGRDAVVWNAHRIYGRTRWPRLIEGWRVVHSFGFDESIMDAELGRWDQQPVWILENAAASNTVA